MQTERELEASFLRFRDQADMRALARVFDAVAPQLLAIARHFSRGREDAEDLVQATFLTAIEKAPSFDGSRALIPWLLGILSLHAHVQRARQGRELDHARLRAIESEPPEREVRARELADAVASAVASMPAAYATVVRRHLVDGARPNELALELGISPVNARVRLHRGLKLLRAAIPSGFAGLGFGWLASWSSLRTLRRKVLSEASARTGAAIPSSLATTLAVAVLAVAAFSAPAWLPLVRGAKDSSIAHETSSAAAMPSDTNSSGQIEDGVAAAEPTSEGARVAVATEAVEAQSARSPNERAIRGRLLLPDGAPAAGARVELAIPAALKSAWTPPDAVIAAADGQFAIQCEPPPKTVLALKARLERFATMTWRWNDLAAQGDVELGDATFERAGTLKIALVDARGAPLSSGWLVDVFDASESRRGNQEMIQRQVPVLDGGLVTLDDLAPRRYRVRATCGVLAEVAWTQVDVAADRTSELPLAYDGPDPARRIGINVRARAPAEVIDLDARHVKLSTRDGSTRTAVEPPHTVGRFLFEDVEPGAYQLVVDDPRFAKLERAVSAGESVRVELTGASAIALHVRGADGRDIERYALSATVVEPNMMRMASKLRSMDAPAPEGGVFTSFLPGDTRLEIAIDGAPAKTVMVEDLVSGETRVVEATFGGALALGGRVLEQGGARPAAGVTVELLRGGANAPGTDGAFTVITSKGSGTISSSNAATSTTSAQDGAFRFEALEPGTWTVRARWNSLLSVERVIELADEAPRPIELVQPASGWFEGVVEARAGGAPWVLTARPSKFDAFQRSLAADADAAGKFRLGPLPVGSFRVDASRKSEPGSGWGNGATSFVAFESKDEQHPSYAIEAGKVTALRLGAAGLPTASAKVRVVIEGGSANGATVFASTQRTPLHGAGVLLSANVIDGVATLEHLESGSYLLSVRAANDAWEWRSEKPIVLRADETTESALTVRLASRVVRVVGKDSKPFARQPITWSTDGGAHDAEGATRDAGDIALTLPEGRVRFACPGFTLAPAEVDWRASSDEIVLVATKSK